MTVDVAVLVGDANCDDRLSAADLTAIVRRIALPEAPACDADVDDDGDVDAADVDRAIALLYSAPSP